MNGNYALGTKTKPKSFTPEGLRVLSKPSTWFRKTLVELTKEEFKENPQLGLMFHFLVQEEAPIARLDYEKGRITKEQYEKRLNQLAKQIGNLFYK